MIEQFLFCAPITNTQSIANIVNTLTQTVYLWSSTPLCVCMCMCVFVGSYLATKADNLPAKGRGWVIIKQASDEQRSTANKCINLIGVHSTMHLVHLINIMHCQVLYMCVSDQQKQYHCPQVLCVIVAKH